jgi:hypothetical protein
MAENALKRLKKPRFANFFMVGANFFDNSFAQ